MYVGLNCSKSVFSIRPVWMFIEHLGCDCNCFAPHPHCVGKGQKGGGGGGGSWQWVSHVDATLDSNQRLKGQLFPDS